MCRAGDSDLLPISGGGGDAGESSGQTIAQLRQSIRRMVEEEEGRKRLALQVQLDQARADLQSLRERLEAEVAEKEAAIESLEEAVREVACVFFSLSLFFAVPDDDP